MSEVADPIERQQQPSPPETPVMVPPTIPSRPMKGKVKGGGQEDAKRATAFRFGAADDKNLLLEVAHLVPFNAGHGNVSGAWVKVAENLIQAFQERHPGVACNITGSAAQRRFKTLHTDWETQTKKSRRQSGVEEDPDEIESLHQDIHDAMQEGQAVKDEATTKKKAEEDAREKIGGIIRDSALSQIQGRKRGPKPDATGEEVGAEGADAEELPLAAPSARKKRRSGLDPEEGMMDFVGMLLMELKSSREDEARARKLDAEERKAAAELRDKACKGKRRSERRQPQIASLRSSWR
ncbi:hypothetical protein HDU96_000797 [Phlyctochytrium bullatum]|nr:hypothetical protein HDU96_000797 [Phlyctochytrium bullatum]